MVGEKFSTVVLSFLNWQEDNTSYKEYFELAESSDYDPFDVQEAVEKSSSDKELEKALYYKAVFEDLCEKAFSCYLERWHY